MKTTIIASLGLASLTILGQGATITTSVVQSASGAEGSSPINLTTEGTLDWGIWETPATLVPSDSMSGGAGFGSLTLVGGATQHPGSFGNPQNAYSWTNGTTLASASNITNAARSNFLGNADGIRLSLDIAEAGTYQLKFYTTTANDITIDGTASLLNGGVSDIATGATQTALAKSEYTVDFTTDGADTLTIDVVKTAGASSIFAYEAFTLSGAPSVPEPSSLALLGLGGFALLARRRK